jgi:hypothetical protein
MTANANLVRDDKSNPIPVLGWKDAEGQTVNVVTNTNTSEFTVVADGVYELTTAGSPTGPGVLYITVDGTAPSPNTNGAGYPWQPLTEAAHQIHMLPNQTRIRFGNPSTSPTMRVYLRRLR